MEPDGVPSGLQNLTFGREFNQSMDHTALPSGFEKLTFGRKFNQSLDNTALPSGSYQDEWDADDKERDDEEYIKMSCRTMTIGNKIACAPPFVEQYCICTSFINRRPSACREVCEAVKINLS